MALVSGLDAHLSSLRSQAFKGLLLDTGTSADWFLFLFFNEFIMGIFL